MMPAEIRHKLRYVEILTNRGARNHKAGEFRSRQRGRGFEFDEHRPYRTGDDYRMIDWNVTARLQHPYLKRNFEEKELSAILAIDASRSMHFTTGEQSKRELLLEIVATLAFSAVADGIRLGLLIFTDRVELFIPPRQGRARVWSMLDAIWDHQPASWGTDIHAALKFLTSALARMAIVFFISDFIGQQELAESPSYKLIADRHDFVPVIIGDPLDAELPQGSGVLRVRDAETGETLQLSLTPHSREQYKDALESRGRRLRKAFFRRGIQDINVQVDQNYVVQLMQFFFARKRK